MAGGRHLLAVLAAAALPLNPLAAQVSDAECATMRLLANSETDLSVLSLQYRRDGLMDLLVSGKGDTLVGASQCELISNDGLSLTCQWRSDAKAEAQARFNKFRAQLDRCLPWAEMEYKKDPYATDSLKVLERYTGEAGGDEYGAGDVDLQLEFVEYKTYDKQIYYWVEAEFQR